MEPVIMPRFLLLSLLLVILMPLLFRQSRQTNFETIKTVFRNPLIAFFGVFTITNIVMIGLATNLSEAVFSAAQTVLYLAFLTSSFILMLQHRQYLLYSCRAISVLMLALGVIGILQYSGLAFTDLPGNYVVYATFANKNLLASVLSLMLPFAIYGVMQQKGYWSIAAMLGLIAGLFVIGIANTRAAWLAVALGITATLGAAYVFRSALNVPKKLGQVYKKRLTYILALGLLTLAVAAMSHFGFTRQDASRSKKIAGEARQGSSIDERFTLWSITGSMIVDHPLGGVGPGNWKIHMPSYGMEKLRSRFGNLNFIRPHNDFLWVFSETGILGFAAFLGIFITAFLFLWKIIQGQQAPEDKLLALLLGMSVIIYLTVSMFSFPRERIFHSMVLLHSLAALAYLYQQQTPAKSKAPDKINWHTGAYGLLLLLLLPGLYIGWQRFNGEIHTKKAITAQLQKKWSEQISHVTNAMSPWYQIDPSGTPLHLYRGGAKIQLNKFEEAYTDLKEADRQHPYHIVVLANLGAYYDRKGDFKKAMGYFERALEMSPTMEGVLLNVAAIHIKQRQFDKALDFLDKCHPESRDPRVKRFREIIEQQKQASGNQPKKSG